VVHVHSPFPLAEAAQSLLGPGQAKVVTFHAEVTRQRRLMKLYAPVLRQALQAADRIIATSPTLRDASPWLAPVRDRCRVVPLSVDAHAFAPAGPCFGEPGPTVLFVGRLRHYKGLDALLRAMRLLPENVSLAIVGDGPMGPAWRGLALELGLGDRARFLGEVSDAGLRLALGRAAVLALPSTTRSEAFGVCLLEAMASGLPCVATELGTGTSWVVRHGETGLVVRPGDPEALAGALARILDAPELARAMGLAGRRRVEERFSPARMLAGVMDTYEEALACASR